MSKITTRQTEREREEEETENDRKNQGRIAVILNIARQRGLEIGAEGIKME